LNSFLTQKNEINTREIEIGKGTKELGQRNSPNSAEISELECGYKPT
jgi:hypothetical protein